MTVVYNVSFDGLMCGLICARCGCDMDMVTPDVVTALTHEAASPCCMDCDGGVADTVPLALWPDFDGQTIAFVIDPAHHAEFDVFLPPNYPNQRRRARPAYTAKQIGWAESLSGSPKVNKQAKGKSLKKRRKAKKAKKESPKVAEKQANFWSGY